MFCRLASGTGFNSKSLTWTASFYCRYYAPFLLSNSQHKQNTLVPPNGLRDLLKWMIKLCCTFLLTQLDHSCLFSQRLIWKLDSLAGSLKHLLLSELSLTGDTKMLNNIVVFLWRTSRGTFK